MGLPSSCASFDLLFAGEELVNKSSAISPTSWAVPMALLMPSTADLISADTGQGFCEHGRAS